MIKIKKSKGKRKKKNWDSGADLIHLQVLVRKSQQKINES